jgi:hypothetical protein
MKQRDRLRLLAAALLCAVPLTAPAQTVHLNPPPRYVPPRLSHVPIQGGVEPALADQYLRDRLERAETAQLERLLADLAEHPEKLGIKPEDRDVLKRALEQAEGRPEKMLQDPEVQRVLGKTAQDREKRADLSPEDQKRLEEIRDRFLPPTESTPSEPGKPDQQRGTPDGPQATKPADVPKGAAVAPPATPPTPPAPEAGAAPAPPPAAKDRLRGLAETFAERGLTDSPAFRRMMADLSRVRPPESSDAWGRRLHGLENRFGDLGSRLTSLSWPRTNSAPRGPGGRFGPAVAAPAEGGGAGPVVLVLLAMVTAAAVAWGLLRRRDLVVLRRARAGRPLGPWPVRPESVSTRDDLVRAFEYLALLLLGPGARSRNHRAIAAGLGRDDAARRGAAERLAALYEQARYAPPDEALPEAELAAARADLSLLAGVAAA